MFNDNNRGQVGIGTLIVFIAMVLVAAIAAGVLINTAGLLQSQAEATGEESSQQVSDRVQLSTVVGTTGSSDIDGSGNPDQLINGEIDRIALTTFRSPGADDIDLTQVTIEVFANGNSDTLIWDSDTDDGSFGLDSDYELAFDDANNDNPNDNIDGFAVVNVQGADDGSLSDSSDRAQIVFDLSEIDGPDNDDATLESGEAVSISVTTAAGATAFIEKRAPSTVEEEQTYRL